MPSVFLDKAVMDKKKDAKLLREFFIETLNVIQQNGRDPAVDVRWVGDVDGNICMTWAEFERHATGFMYLPRGRCAYITTKDDKPVSYFDGEEGIMNRIPPDLIVAGEDFFLRRFIHSRMTEAEQPRKNGGIYNESPEFWEFISLPKRNSPFLMDNMNAVRVFATDNVKMARNLLTLNTEQGKGDPEFKRFEDMERNAVRVKRTNAPKRRVGGGF